MWKWLWNGVNIWARCLLTFIAEKYSGLISERPSRRGITSNSGRQCFLVSECVLKLCHCSEQCSDSLSVLLSLEDDCWEQLLRVDFIVVIVVAGWETPRLVTKHLSSDAEEPGHLHWTDWNADRIMDGTSEPSTNVSLVETSTKHSEPEQTVQNSEMYCECHAINYRVSLLLVHWLQCLISTVIWLC